MLQFLPGTVSCLSSSLALPVNLVETKLVELESAGKVTCVDGVWQTATGRRGKGASIADARELFERLPATCDALAKALDRSRQDTHGRLLRFERDGLVVRHDLFGRVVWGIAGVPLPKSVADDEVTVLLPATTADIASHFEVTRAAAKSRMARRAVRGAVRWDRLRDTWYAVSC